MLYRITQEALNNVVKHSTAGDATPTDGRLYSPVYEGHWTDAGTVESLIRAAEIARDDDHAGNLAPPVERPVP